MWLNCFKNKFQDHNTRCKYLLVVSSVIIGVGRFRILGGQGLEYWGGGVARAGGANSQQAHDVVMTSIRRLYVASMSCAH